MRRIFLIPVLLIHLFFYNHANAEIRPANDAQLHYTQIMFEYNEVNGADRYVVTVTPIKDPNAKPWIVENRSLACMISGFRFGKTYFWHYEAFAGNKQIFKSEEFHFNIVSNYLVDSSLFNCPIEISKQGQFNDDIVFIDYRGIAIDRKGQPVWYFPAHTKSQDQDPLFRNLRMTNDGTITFLDDSSCYEVDVDGNNLWKAPDDGKISGDAKEHYHHDFKKLDDGTYLAAGWKYENEKNLYNPSRQCQVRYNTLIQYDSKGKILWHWNEKDHIPKEVIYGVYTGADSIIAGTHMNAFDYNPMENTIIASCRHNSSVIKIDKKSGKVIYTVGLYDNKMKAQGVEPLFLHQHGMAILPDQQFAFYDNYVPDDPNHGITYPRVIIFKEPSKNLPAYKTWEFECKSSRYPNGITGKGGYVMPLPNGNLLVCMGGANYAFEINMKKEIVWQCDFEKYDPYNRNWNDYIAYRCTSVSSLFPYYFTVQDATKDDSNLYSFKLNNEGSENDTYQIEVTAGGKKIASQTVDVSKQSSRQINVPVKSKNASKEIEITVSRKSDAAQSKKLTFNKQASNLSTSSTR